MFGSGSRDERIILGVAFVGVALVLGYALTLSGEQRDYFLYYNVPIAAPFAGFVAERAMGWRRTRGLLVDAGVVTLALARVFVAVPACSGHALFCAYAGLSTRSATVRALGLSVLAEVAFIKVVLWRDFTTLAGGLVVAGVASLLYSSARSASRTVRTRP